MSRKESSNSTTNKDIAYSYNKFKEYEGKQYTGMKVGRSHSWIYDQGQWKEKKITPDKWEINYAVTKRRKGKAPEGSGVPVGTKYHWFILADQVVEKLNANDYSTEMTGVKYKIAHQRANKDEWNISEQAQKKRLIKILKELVKNLEEEITPKEKERDERKVAKIKPFPKKIVTTQDSPLRREKLSKSN